MILKPVMLLFAASLLADGVVGWVFLTVFLALAVWMAVQWLAPNTKPIYSKLPSINGVAVGGTANTQSGGVGTIGTDIYKAFTADATNGSFVSRIRLSPVATVAATATSATVLRIFISNKTSGATTQADTWLFQEVAAPAQTADQTTTATNFIEVPLGFALPPSYTILVSSHIVNAANTSWTATVLGGDF